MMRLAVALASPARATDHLLDREAVRQHNRFGAAQDTTRAIRALAADLAWEHACGCADGQAWALVRMLSPAAASSLPSSPLGNRWPYTSMVMAIEACPMRCCTIFAVSVLILYCVLDQSLNQCCSLTPLKIVFQQHRPGPNISPTGGPPCRATSGRGMVCKEHLNAFWPITSSSASWWLARCP